MENLNLSTKQHLMGMYHVIYYDINLYNYHYSPAHKPNNINHPKWVLITNYPNFQ